MCAGKVLKQVLVQVKSGHKSEREASFSSSRWRTLGAIASLTLQTADARIQ
jgi:hypothetical protein